MKFSDVLMIKMYFEIVAWSLVGLGHKIVWKRHQDIICMYMLSGCCLLVHAGHWDMSCLIVLEVWKSKRQTWLYTCSIFQLFILYFANTPSPCWLSQFEPLPLESKAPATVVLLLNSPEEDILIKACEAIQTFAEKGMVGYPPLTLPHIIDCFYFYGQPCSWIAENPVLILLSGWCFVMVYFFDMHFFLNPEIATFAIHFITICLIFLFTVSPCC